MKSSFFIGFGFVSCNKPAFLVCITTDLPALCQFQQRVIQLKPIFSCHYFSLFFDKATPNFEYHHKPFPS